MINLGEKNYSLCGVIGFEPPAVQGMIGHYKAFVNSFNSWTEFDDLKNQPHTISMNAKVVIASLLYIKLKD